MSQLSWFVRSIRPAGAPERQRPRRRRAPRGPSARRPRDPGDPHGVTLEGPAGARACRRRRSPRRAWSGWPADWNTPSWHGHTASLTDIAWKCLDLNASLLATMPPYLVDAAPTLGRRAG